MVQFSIVGRTALAALLTIPSTDAFIPSSSTFTSTVTKQVNIHQHATQRTEQLLQMSSKNLIVISPPGGVGEVAAVQAAKTGSSVKWFVVSPQSQFEAGVPSAAAASASASAVAISSQTLNAISSAGGSLQLAGAEADTLLLPNDDPSSSINAISTWSRSSGASASTDGVICVVDDGIEEAVTRAARLPGVSAKSMEPAELMKMNNVLADAIKVAAKEVCSSVSASSSVMKVAVMPSTMDIPKVLKKKGGSDEKEEEEGEGSGFLSSLFKGNQVDVPKTLSKAMKMNGSSQNFGTLRYGELFGIPESSPDASPLVGGPRRYPILRDEYTMRSIRIDPTISMSGSAGNAMNMRSSRFSVGEAAVRMATQSLDVEGGERYNYDGTDVCLTSLRGLDEPSDEEWSGEFSRVQEMMSSGRGAQLFSASFGSVPSVERLTDWVATKWAPAVMKTYDIAGIRVGERPVYAAVIAPGKVEITWQDIVDFQSVMVGKMVIEVSESGITATRAPGDASAGYGSISAAPLQGEDILVRRLADAAQQAMEKGLATKPKPKSRQKKEVVETTVVSTVVSAGSVPVPESTPQPETSKETGPRSSGARRSSERARGSKRRRKSSSD